jgi:predicted ATPase with chaperone activity
MYQRPQDRIVINLAPAEMPKQAASFDRPMSLGILVGSGQISSDRLEDYAVVGELALDGSTHRNCRLEKAQTLSWQDGGNGVYNGQQGGRPGEW